MSAVLWCDAKKMSYTLISFVMDICSSLCNSLYIVIFILGHIMISHSGRVMVQAFFFFEEGGLFDGLNAQKP